VLTFFKKVTIFKKKNLEALPLSGAAAFTSCFWAGNKKIKGYPVEIAPVHTVSESKSSI
jgi:hypothetical protein